jgi:Fur family transcriptional regulator, ferric uptake regulator
MSRPALPRHLASPMTATEIEALVRISGGRVTPGRRAVIDALLGAATWLTADDVLVAVHDAWPRANEAAVYRALESLEQLGVISHTHLGHTASHWHLATDPRQSLVCESCGRVQLVPTTWLDALYEQIRTELEFVVAPDHFAWSGFCARCAGDA